MLPPEGQRPSAAVRPKDDVQEIYPLLDEAEMIVLASPVYYHGFSGQLQCTINRIYALDKPQKLKRQY